VLLHWFKSLFIKYLLRDELRVSIYPQQIKLQRLKRSFKNGLKPQLVCKQVIDLPHRAEINHLEIKSNDANDWQILAKYLKQALMDAKWQGAKPTVIVSNHFVRYAIIPWNAELAIESERQAYMRHCFTLAYGEPAKAWDLRMSEPSFGQSAIASAMNSSFLQTLHEVFAEAGMALTTVYPQLMLAMNQTIRQVKQQNASMGAKQALNFWLVTIHSQRVCLTLLENNSWRLVKNVALAANVSEQVTALIQREIVNCNADDETPVLLYWPESKKDQPLKLTHYKVIYVLPHPLDKPYQQAPSSRPDWVQI